MFDQAQESLQKAITNNPAHATAYAKLAELLRNRLKKPQEADPRLLEYESPTRAEIDNTLAIIGLIEGRERQMLVTAPTPELEDIFLLSPQITDQLRQKIAIMEAHRLDGKRAFRTHNH